MTDPIVAFLTARLDDDARIAQGAAEDAGDTTWTDDSDGRLYSGAAVIAEMRDGTAAQDISFYIASHDPRRVLADVEAKRELVRRFHRMTAVGYRGDWDGDYVECACGWTAPVERSFDEDRLHENHRWSVDHDGGTPEWVLHVLAQAWSDHPDFDSSWAS